MLLLALQFSGGPGHAVEVLRVQGDIVQWKPATTDGPTTLTYALLDRPHDLPDDKSTLSANNCGAMRPFTDITAQSQAVTIAEARRELRLAFDGWEAVAHVKFVEVSAAATANIVVGATDVPIGRAFTNLSVHGGLGPQRLTSGFAASPAREEIDQSQSIAYRAVAPIKQAYICLNARMPWKIGFDGNLGIYDLRHTFLHEIGHAIGLDHPGSSGAVMGYRYDERIRTLQATDIAAAQYLYGPPR